MAKRKLTRNDVIHQAIFVGVAKFLGASNNLIALQLGLDSLKYIDDGKPKKNGRNK